MGTSGKQRTLRRWELALLLGTALAALLGVWLDGQQSALAGKVIRLHVIANSDTAADQALKLAVRDRILEEAEDLFAPGASLEEARAALEEALPALAAAGAEAVGEQGYTYPVSAALEDGVWFPTKEYGDFALPAGQYTALRLTIGEGAGQNWWCVVFPPLCLGSVSETAAETAAGSGFSREEIALIAGEDEGYVVKFKAIELWEELQSWLEAQKGGA